MQMGNLNLNWELNLHGKAKADPKYIEKNYTPNAQLCARRTHLISHLSLSLSLFVKILNLIYKVGVVILVTKLFRRWILQVNTP